MNIKKGLMASLLAISLLPIECINVSAVESYSSPTELVTAMVEKSLSGITSDTMSDAISTMQSKITTNGDEVLYDGHSIGYWYSDDSTYLYADASKTSKNIGLNWEVNPKTLSLILTDVNEELVDTIVPTTSDWSKIIGKYDVTLGDVTIPASQWVPLEAASDPLGENKVADISALTGINVRQPSYYAINEYQIFISAYVIDKHGNLYIQNGATSHQYDGSRGWIWARGCWLTNDAPDMLALSMDSNSGSSSTAIASGVNKIKAGISIEKENNLYLYYYTTDLTNACAYKVLPTGDDRSSFTTLYNISNAAVKNTTPITDMVQTGIFYFTYGQAGVSSESAVKSARLKFFEKQSSSRKTIGNQVIRRRISALNSLLPTDTVTLTADGWTVNGLSSIDTYISDQSLFNAGDTANIPAVADIDALQFNVILPTSLPVYVDAANVTYVADNANIVNKSGAPVQLTEVTIEPEADSGWTFVSGKPSPNIGDNEFNFSTTIEKAKVLNINETYPFTYMANLSPTTESSTSLELATVMVTVDWATTSGG